jgi:hypothetical protein
MLLQFESMEMDNRVCFADIDVCSDFAFISVDDCSNKQSNYLTVNSHRVRFQ